MKFVILSSIASVIMCIVCIIVFTLAGSATSVIVAAGCFSYMITMSLCGIVGIWYMMSTIK